MTGFKNLLFTQLFLSLQHFCLLKSVRFERCRKITALISKRNLKLGCSPSLYPYPFFSLLPTHLIPAWWPVPKLFSLFLFIRLERLALSRNAKLDSKKQFPHMKSLNSISVVLSHFRRSFKVWSLWSFKAFTTETLVISSHWVGVVVELKFSSETNLYFNT